jgi:hypothetical protein
MKNFLFLIITDYKVEKIKKLLEDKKKIRIVFKINKKLFILIIISLFKIKSIYFFLIFEF